NRLDRATLLAATARFWEAQDRYTDAMTTAYHDTATRLVLENAGKLSCTTDFDTDADRLRALLTVADVVLEGSRPAALARRGLGPEDIPGPPGRVWLRITGHGDGSVEGRVAFGEGAARVAFGDDAAVAGGLVGRAPDGSPVFCGDAIADPLTGLAAAAAVSEVLDAVEHPVVPV
ncbi:CoA transferase, partial [Mycolicibacterium insubricum]|uniref:CoA transferase n=1 Tax=Mycolicibacterium insubricum TaxID=444597 RepID=UPI0021F2660A